MPLRDAATCCYSLCVHRQLEGFRGFEPTFGDGCRVGAGNGRGRSFVRRPSMVERREGYVLMYTRSRDSHRTARVSLGFVRKAWANSLGSSLGGGCLSVSELPHARFGKGPASRNSGCLTELRVCLCDSLRLGRLLPCLGALSQGLDTWLAYPHGWRCSTQTEYAHAFWHSRLDGCKVIHLTGCLLMGG